MIYAQVNVLGARPWPACVGIRVEQKNTTPQHKNEFNMDSMTVSAINSCISGSGLKLPVLVGL